MIRKQFIDNVMKLNKTEVDILVYVTNKPFGWFVNPKEGSDNEVLKVVTKSFEPYYGHNVGEKEHPFYAVYRRLAYGAYFDKLIYQTDLYDDEYMYYAEQVNSIYGTEKRSVIKTILKAFAERDFDELVCRYSWEKSITLKVIQDNIDSFLEEIVSNLDTQDLGTIIMFCKKV